MTNPAHTHQALISADAPPRSACGDSGPSTARAADVTCPTCLDLAAAHKASTEPAAVVHQAPVPDAGVVSCGGVGNEAFLPTDVTCPACRELNGRPVVHDSHAISADDEVKPTTQAEINPGDLFRDRDNDEWVAVSTGHETFLVSPAFLHATKQGVEEWGPLVKLSDCEPITAVEPAKTHDLSVFRNQGKLVIAVEDETDDLRVYLPEGVDKDLGRALALLTPAQITLLISELTGDEK